MDYNKTNLNKIDFWHRRIITSHWFICLFYLIGQLIFLYLRTIYYSSEPLNHFLIMHVILPNVLLLVIMLLTEIFYRFSKKYREDLTLSLSFFVSYTILITITPLIRLRHVVLLLPIFVAIFYFKRKKLLSVFVIDLVLFVILYVSIPHQREYTSMFEFFVIILMLASATLTGNGIIKRGEELLWNIEELTKSEEKLIIEKTIIDKLSKTDALTNLYNHITFHEYLDGVLKQCADNSMPLHLALMDIDDFKQVNDTFGHRAGDTVLKKVSEIVISNITPNDFAARYGGEEFAIVFAEKTVKEALTIVEKIREEVENTVFFDDCDKVTISAGLHSYSGNEGKEALFNSTDALLYTAKLTGKNKIVCSDPIK